MSFIIFSRHRNRCMDLRHSGISFLRLISRYRTQCTSQTHLHNSPCSDHQLVTISPSYSSQNASSRSSHTILISNSVISLRGLQSMMHISDMKVHFSERKRNLKEAFRMIPIGPLDCWLFIFEWNGKLYVDIFLPFGPQTAQFIFNLFSEINDPDPEFFGPVASYLGLAENLKKPKDDWIVDFTGMELDFDRMKLACYKINIIEQLQVCNGYSLLALSLIAPLKTFLVSSYSALKLFHWDVLSCAIFSIFRSAFLIYIHMESDVYPQQNGTSCGG